MTIEVTIKKLLDTLYPELKSSVVFVELLEASEMNECGEFIQQLPVLFIEIKTTGLVLEAQVSTIENWFELFTGHTCRVTVI